MEFSYDLIMELLEALYTVLIICTVAITVVIGMVGYEVVLTMKRVRVTLEKVEGLSMIPDMVKNSAQAGIFGLAGWILNKLNARR